MSLAAAIFIRTSHPNRTSFLYEAVVPSAAFGRPDKDKPWEGSKTPYKLLHLLHVLRVPHFGYCSTFVRIRLNPLVKENEGMWTRMKENAYENGGEEGAPIP